MRKRKKKSLHKFDFNNMPEDLQLIVLFLFMIVGAIITVITYPFRFFKKSQEEEHEEYSFGRYEIREITKTESGDIIMNLNGVNTNHRRLNLQILCQEHKQN